MLQVALKVDSVESQQGGEQQERPNSNQLPPLSPRTSSPAPLNASPLSSSSVLSVPSCSPITFPFPPPSTLPPPPTSPSLLLPPPPSPRLPLRPSSLRRPRPLSAASFCDPADEEVSHITSSAQQRWREQEGIGQESRGKTGRSHSLSPYNSPHPFDSRSNASSPHPPLPSSSRSTLSLLAAGLKDHDFRKGFSVDNQGLLDKPTSLSVNYAEDQRRHSIEVCLVQDVITTDDQHFHRSEKGGHAFPVRVQSVGGAHRKKKMSPPCISIHPPSEKEDPQTGSLPPMAEQSMMLRRRTPSYDLAPHTQSNTRDISVDLPAFTQTPTPMHTTLSPVHVAPQGRTPTRVLTPSCTSTPPHTPAYAPSTPTHLHIPIGTNIFIQPHAPLLPNNSPFIQTRSPSPATRHSPLTGDCMPRPQFTFDEPQSRYMGGLSDADRATCSSPFENRLGSGTGFSAKNRRTAQ